MRPGTALGSGPSLFLDLLRLMAALVVAFGHLTQPQFSSGWPDLTPFAVDAVTVFFVLSGFVVRFVTVSRPATLSSYLRDRASRLYSVLLPAILLACVADLRIAPSPLSATSLAHLLSVLAANLTFTAYSWHLQVRFLSDSPMWSLNFEALFYLLYGVAFYLAGRRRRLLLLAAAALAGPEVLALFPVWLVGCLLFECFTRLRSQSWALPSCTALMAALAGITAACLHAVANAPHDPPWLHATTPQLAFLLPHIGHGTPLAWRMFPLAALAFGLMLTCLLAADRLFIADNSSRAQLLRRLAEATFPLYLMHLPIYFLAVSAVGHPLHAAAAKLTLLLGVFAISVWLGHLCNRLKLTLRTGLLALTLPETTTAGVRGRLWLPETAPRTGSALSRT